MSRASSASVYLSAVAFELGEARPLADLAPFMTSETFETLRTGGGRDYRRADRSAPELAGLALSASLAKMDASAASPDLILYCTSQGVGPGESEALSAMLRDIGVLDAPICGVSLAGCAGVVAAIRLGRALLRTGEARRIAIVASEVCPTPASRLPLGAAAAMSDGAASCILSTDPGDYEVLAIGQAANQRLRGSNPHTGAMLQLMLWGRGVRQAYLAAAADLGVEAVPAHSIVATNLSQESMLFLARQCGLQPEDVFLDSLPELSHVMGADPLINLTMSGTWRHRRAAPRAPFLVLALSPYAWGCLVLADHREPAISSATAPAVATAN